MWPFFLVPKIHFHAYNSFKIILHIFILFRVFPLISKRNWTIDPFGSMNWTHVRSNMATPLALCGAASSFAYSVHCTQFRTELVVTAYALLLAVIICPFFQHFEFWQPEQYLYFSSLHIMIFQKNIPCLIYLRPKCSEKIQKIAEFFFCIGFRIFWTKDFFCRNYFVEKSLQSIKLKNKVSLK